MSKTIGSILFCLLIPASLYASDDWLVEKTGNHICSISSSKNKCRLAVYTFTDQNDQETDETKKYTTKIISVILGCKDIKIIDPSKIQAVMDEQAKGLLGIVDDETAPETGKLLGADALVFGQIEKNNIQIRLIDATTGEIIGATVQESSNSKDPEVKIEKFDNEASKMDFRRSQLKKQLEFLFKNHPGVFLFMTSTDDELEKFRENSPQGYERINSQLKKAPDDKKNKFNRTRKMVLEIREKDKKFNNRIIQGHKKILSKPSRPSKPSRRPPRRR